MKRKTLLNPKTHLYRILTAHADRRPTTWKQAARIARIKDGSCPWHRCSDLRQMGLLRWVRGKGGRIIKDEDCGLSEITVKGLRVLGAPV